MNIDALAWALRQKPRTAAEKLALIGLAERADAQGAVAYPKDISLEARLADEIGVSLREMRGALPLLMFWGFLDATLEGDFVRLRLALHRDHDARAGRLPA